VHHLLKEDNFREQCLYCGNNIDLEKFKTQHTPHEQMYKVATCDCGKEVSIKISHNNKHDCSWLEKEIMDSEHIKHNAFQ